MKHVCATLALVSTLCLSLSPTPAHAINFGKKDAEATAKVTHGGTFKSQSTYALGAFRVAFVTEDSAASVSRGVFAGTGAAALMSGSIEGVDHALMQKIADQVYADFLKQATLKGFTLVDSATLATRSPTYTALEQMPNFDDGRLGTYVIPTGQRSVPLAADGSKKLGKGSKGMFDSMRLTTQTMDNAEANKAFPKISAEVGTPVLAVTMVVNFANFKGGNTSFGTAKASIQVGATVDGFAKGDALPSTGIAGWDAKTAPCGLCHAEVALEGQVHSTDSIGSSDTHSTMKAGDHLANGIASLAGTSQTNKKGTFVTADPAAYEKNVLLVASEATDILLSGLAKEK